MILVASFGDFIGRFHPVLVHLPIGFLMLTILLEWNNKEQKFNQYIIYGWLLSALSALGAAICGWFLAAEGSYAANTLFWHRWLGIAITILAFVGWQLKVRGDQLSPLFHRGFNGITFLLLLIGGHQGGNLTHGSSYLVENAPAPIQKLVGYGGTMTDEYPKLINPDSTLVFEDVVQPLLEKKCMQCHNDEVTRGGLNMSNREQLEEGGDNGPVIKAGHALDSELFRRLTLNVSNPKYMPPKGQPLSYPEKRLISWWLSQPELFGKTVTESEVTPEIKATLLQLFSLDTDPKPYYEMAEVEPMPEEAILKVEEKGFKVSTLAKENYFLEVSWPLGKDSLSLEDFQALEPLKDHITWLNLGSSGVTDEYLDIVAQFSNLTRLRLENTTISDAGVAKIKNLPHLESLNLYATKVSNESISYFKSLKELKRLFLWQTEVTGDAVEQLETDRPKLEVDIGISPEDVLAEGKESQTD